MTSPLEGIKIADFTQLMQGPLCTQTLADLGADVVKVERPGVGEIGRQSSPYVVGDQTAFFVALNRNKRSLAVDLKTEDGRAVVSRLIDEADVVVENFRPGTMERLGLGYDRLRTTNPGLVYASASGYGSAGPFAERPGQDLLIQAVAGAASLTGRPSDPPTPSGMFVADAYSGMLLTVGILTALVERTRTGVGQRVDISLYAALLHLQSQELVTYLNTGLVPKRAEQAGHALTDGPYGIYAVSDGYIAISVCPLDKLGPLIGRPDLADQFTGRAMFDRRDEMKVVIEEALAESTLEQWLDKLWAADVWCAPVLDYPTLVESEQFKASGMRIDLDGVPGGAIGLPFQLSGHQRAQPTPPPLVGEHTATVMSELGYSDDQVRSLLGRGVASQEVSARRVEPKHVDGNDSGMPHTSHVG